MPNVTSTLQINLVDDVSANAKKVAAALEQAQKQTLALEAALAKSALSDKLQGNLKKIGAGVAHVQGASMAWEEYAKRQGLAGKATVDFTRADIAARRSWEGVTLSALRAVRSEEAALARLRHDQTARNEREAIRAAQHKAAEEKRIAEQAARDGTRLAEQQERDRKRATAQALRDYERDEKRRVALMEREQREAQRHAERLAHERARTDNTVAGVAALYAAHSAVHAAVKVGERYREFDKERRYAQVVMGLNDEQMKPLVNQAIRGSAGSKFNDVQWLAAQRSLAARGYNRDQVLGFTPTASQLGQAFDVPMVEGVKLFEGAMLGFKKDVSSEAAARRSAQRTADLEVKSSKISGLDADDMIQLYKRGAQSAKMAGLTEENLLAFGSVAKKLNIGGDESATAFVALTKNLLKPTHEARTAMHAAGIDFTKYQKQGTFDEAGFTSEVARNYGVKLSHSIQEHLHRVFTNPELMRDPDKLMPAVTRYMRGALGGKDAKSLSSITGLMSRYRDASMQGVDTQGLLAAIMAGMAKNPALANAIFGSKQGGRIAGALDPAMFAHMMDELLNHSDGFAQKVSDARMDGFNGALDKFTNQVAILETSIGRAFDNDGRGGFLTGATLAAAKFVEVLGEANPRLLRAGSEAVLLAGGFAALKGVDFFRNGFGLKTAASALDRSAIMLDEAAIKLGASKGALPEGVVPPGGAPPAEVASRGFFGKGGFKGGIKGAAVGGPAAIAEFLAYQAATGLIDTGVQALPFAKTNDATRDYLENRGPIDIVRDLWGNMTGSAKLAGHRAAGGPVGLGRPYLVGEHGAEIFTPGATGQITSNAKLLAMLDKGGDDETAVAVRDMGRGLVIAVDGIARAIAQADATRTSWNALADAGGGSGGGSSGGRRGFMMLGSATHPTPHGRRALLERGGDPTHISPHAAREHLRKFDAGSPARGPVKPPGAGVGPTTARGKVGGLSPDQMAAAQESYNFWRGKGATHEQALAALGNEKIESGFNARARGDKGTAHGIYQWHSDRREKIFAGTGIDIDKASHSQQLEAAYWEMTQGEERAGGRAFFGSKTVEEAEAALVDHYERPQERHFNKINRAKAGRQFDHVFSPVPQDDPLGLRKGNQRQRSDVPLNDLTPTINNRSLHETAALLDHIHRRMRDIHVASDQNRRGSTGAHIAGLGARLRGGYTGSGNTFG